MIHHFLSDPDAERALKVLRKLALHDISQWAIAGGWAIEIHCVHNRQPSAIRRLSDIDFVASEFDSFPITMAEAFLFRHVHPMDRPGKMMLQFVDADSALRIDVFRTWKSAMARTGIIELPIVGRMRLAAVEDVIARAARLLLDLDVYIPVPQKHARDYIRISEAIGTQDVNAAWQDHRKPDHPRTFSEADALVRKLIATRHEYLVRPHYSTTAGAACSRCVPDAPFTLADPAQVFSVLGYC